MIFHMYIIVIDIVCLKGGQHNIILPWKKYFMYAKYCVEIFLIYDLSEGL